MSTVGWPLGGALPGRLAPPRPALAGLRAVESAGGVSAVGGNFFAPDPPPAHDSTPTDAVMLRIQNGILQARNLQLAAALAHDKNATEYATIQMNGRLDYLVTLLARRKRAAIGPR